MRRTHAVLSKPRPLSKALSLSKQVLDSADKTRGSYLSTMFDKLNIFADCRVLAHVRERDHLFGYGGKAYRVVFADTGRKGNAAHSRGNGTVASV